MFFPILLFALPMAGFCQSHLTVKLNDAGHSYFSNRSVHHFNLHENNSLFSNLFSIKPYIPMSTVPERLPMFCALEKKLKETCNIWIKIRLPEHPWNDQIY